MGKFLRSIAEHPASFSIEFLLNTAIAIALAVLPATWQGKLALVLLLVVILAATVLSLQLSRRAKVGALLLSIVLVVILAVPTVHDQYRADAILAAYQDKRDLAAKYQTHDESLKRIVAHFDNVRRGQSLFETFILAPNAEQRAAINDRELIDLTSALANLEVVASPMGDALKIRLGENFFRIVYPVPMRKTPNLSFGNIPSDTKIAMVENSNLGFTVLFLPLSVRIENFDFAASAEL